MILQGKAAIVTGAARGVGRATALALARGGCSVLINYNSSHRAAEETSAEICALGAQAWMTGTGPELFAELGGRAQHIEVTEAGGTSALNTETTP